MKVEKTSHCMFLLACESLRVGTQEKEFVLKCFFLAPSLVFSTFQAP